MVRPTLKTYDPWVWPLFVKARPYIKSVDVLLDVGAGIRPQRFITCRRHVCAEPHGEYADILEANGYSVIRGAAPDVFDRVGKIGKPIDTVVIVDVIEHLEKEAGLETLRRAQEIARCQVVNFTPYGFMPQHGGHECDPWGMQGQHWQEHRSGWTEADFPGWHCLIDKNFATHRYPAAFFAIWNKQ
jgi:hypothetical protein